MIGADLNWKVEHPISGEGSKIGGSGRQATWRIGGRVGDKNGRS